MRNLKDTYPDRTIFNPNNPEGTFKNRNDPETPLEPLETPYDEVWAQDLWGFISKTLHNADITPDNSEENINYSQIFDALNYRIKQVNYQERYEYEGDGTDFTITSNLTGWITVKAKAIVLYYPNALPALTWKIFFFIYGTVSGVTNINQLTFSENISILAPYTLQIAKATAFDGDDNLLYNIGINAHCSESSVNPLVVYIKHSSAPTTARYSIYLFFHSATKPNFSFNPDTYPVL